MEGAGLPLLTESARVHGQDAENRSMTSGRPEERETFEALVCGMSGS